MVSGKDRIAFRGDEFEELAQVGGVRPQGVLGDVLPAAGVEEPLDLLL